MHQSMTVDELNEMRGTPVLASDGDKIGSLEEIFYDEQTGKPEWIGVGTGFFGTKRVLVPVEGTNLDGERITVPYSKEQVQDSPDIDGDEVSQDTEADLYAHYGLGYSEQRSDSGLPAGGGAGVDTSPRRVDRDLGDDDTLTRSEEELRVGKRDVESGRVRLRKWVETEPVQTEVELQRETVHVEREAVNEVVSNAEIGEAEIEVPLHVEEAVVEKQVVAKERISLDKDVETETQKVTDEVRRERVEIEGAEDPRGRRR